VKWWAYLGTQRSPERCTDHVSSREWGRALSVRVLGIPMIVAPIVAIVALLVNPAEQRRD
jgi:hypothetical protein